MPDLPREDPMMPVTISQLRASATVDLMTAARALGLGRTKAYELAKREQFPCRVIRIGEHYRIPTAGLLELLGVTAEEPRSPAVFTYHPAPPAAISAPGLRNRMRP
jgi:Helix-turn-helix domain